MTYPADLKPNIDQFSDDPDKFWDEFTAANPAPDDLTGDAKLIWHKDRFSKRYSHCFASVLGGSHPYDAYDLPKDIKTKIRNCMLVASAP